MKKFYLFLVLCCLSIAVKAQTTAAGYNYFGSNGTFTSIASTGTSWTTGMTGDDATHTGCPIGFAFVFCGVSTTTISACSNGWLSLGNSTATQYTNAAANMSFAPAIMPWWDDLTSGSGTSVYQTTGTSPNRKFTFQWTGWSTFSSGTGTFQVVLYETSNIIQIIYGPGTYSGGTASIGICKSTSDYKMLTGNTSASTASSTTFTSSIAAHPANGTIFTFCPNAALPTIAVSGTPGCSPALFTASGASTYTWLATTGLSSTNTAATTATVAATTVYTVTGIATSGCGNTATATVNPSPAAITGLSAVCVGRTTTLSTTTTGGTWSTSDATKLTVNSSTGVIGGVAAGSATITYTKTGCYVTSSITVNPTPTVSVSGGGVFCSGSPATALTASGTGASYTWAPSATLSASTGATVNATPTATTTYTVTSTLGSCTATSTANLNYHNVATTIDTSLGGSFVCIPGTTPYFAASSLAPTVYASGGTYSSNNTSIATVDLFTGMVSGVAAGVATISYSDASCAYTVTQDVTVGGAGFTLAVSPSSANYCIPSGAVNLVASPTGSTADVYLWSDISGLPPASLDNTNTNTVNASPTAAGITTYIVSATNSSTGCHAQTTVNVSNTTPVISGGLTTICPTATTTWSATLGAGTWSSSNTAVATVSAGGVVLGVTAGTATITFTNNSTLCYTTRAVTVLSGPTLAVTPAGTAAACGGVGVSLTASGASTYTWAPNTALSATTGATVTANPTANTTYTITGTAASGCASTLTKVVNYGAGSVTATATSSSATVCPGTNTTLTGSGALSTAPSGYVVSSVPYSLVAQSGTTAVVFSSADDATTPITLPFSFNFFGVNYTTINAGTNGYLNFGTGSTLHSTGIAFPNSASAPPAAISAFYADLSAGAGNVYYSTEGTAPNRKFVVRSINGACCSGGTGYDGQFVLYETTNVIDIQVAATLSNSLTCGIQNAAGTVAATVTGRNGVSYQVTTPETWRFTPASSLLSYTWLPATGVANTAAAVTAATVTGTTTYTVTATQTGTGCSATATTTVSNYPAPVVTITPTAACSGFPITASGLSNYSWTPSTGLSATTGATVTPTVAVPSTYTVTGTNSNGCVGTGTKTVTAPPVIAIDVVAGCAPQVMNASGAGAGGTYTWAPGATLSVTSGTTVTATPTAGATVYTVTGTTAAGCPNTATASVGVAPGSITGTTTVCVTLSTTLSNSVSGGTWSTSDASVATVNPATGMVTGTGSGAATITYTVGTCTPVTTGVTVLTSPLLAVTAVGCAPSPTLTATGASTYSWAPSTALSATTGASVVASPTVTTVYTVTGSNGSCAVTATSTVYPMPQAITGASSVCQSRTTTLSSTSVGGVWSSSNMALATVDAATGVVTGVAAGTPVISYAYAACPANVVTSTITVYSLPSTTITSASNCTTSGTSITLSLAGGGGTYTWSPATYLSATTGASVVSSPTSAITYTVTATGTGGCTNTQTVPVSVLASASPETPTALPTATCIGGSSLLTASVPFSGYSVASIPYSFVTMTGATAAAVSGDDNTIAVTIPFAFSFYGTSYTSINLGTNGYVNFGTGSTLHSTGTAFPNSSAAPPAAIAAFYADLSVTAGNVTYATVGTAPNRKFIVRTINGACCGGGTGYDGQIVLYETSNIIDVQVANTLSNTLVCGIQNQAGTQAVTAPGRNAVLYQVTTPESWRFSPVVFSYAWSPATNLSATTGASVTASPISTTTTYSVTATDAGTGCYFTGSANVAIGPVTATVTAPISVCPSTTGTWTISSTPNATVSYNINGGTTATVALNASGVGTVSQTITAATTLNLVSILAGSCSNTLTGSATIQSICFCTPVYASTASSNAMNRVAITGHSGTSINDTYSPPAAGYIDRTAVSPLTFMQYNTYPINVYYTPSYFYHQDQVWIDFNDDGTFAASENVTPVFGVGGCSTSVSTDASTISIPLTATLGQHRMRVRNTNTLSCTNSTAMSPCASSDGTNTYYYGSTADYTVNIIALPACSGTPSAGTVSASVTNGCAPSFTTNLSTTGSTSASALNYQWLSSTDGITYNPIAGATSISYTATVNAANLYYELQSTCSISGLSNTSAPVNAGITPAITGPTGVCPGTTITLNNARTGGTWSSSSTANATVAGSTVSGVAVGTVSGVAAGTSNISYTTSGCAVGYAITVTANPGTISGTASVCAGSTTTLSNTVTGYTWSSSDTTIAKVNATTGNVRGMAPGTATISYSTGCGTPATVTYTVNAQPTAITGPSTLCFSTVGTLASTPTGGTWTSSSPSTASIDAATGVVTAGTTIANTTISYTVGTCATTLLLAVGNNPPSATISGTSTICAGAISTLSNTVTGGLWSSNNTAVVTINATSGVATGVTAGSATITYDNGCGIATLPFTVNGTPATLTYSSAGLSGPICSGGTMQLNSGTVAGGVYSWSGPNSFSSTLQNPTIAAVTTAATGTYTFSATLGGCATGTRTIAVTVNSTPFISAASTVSSLCAGGSSFLSSSYSAVSSTSNYSVISIPYAFVTQTSPVGITFSSTDDAFSTVTMPFTFNYYGTNYTSINLTTNGYVNFGTGTTLHSTGIAFPNSGSAPLAGIAAFYADLSASPNNVTYSTEGTAPNRTFVVRNINGACCSGGTAYEGEIILYETSNIIDIHVLRTPTNSLTCGIQNAAGTIATTAPGRNGASYQITTPEAWRFAPSFATAPTYAWTPAAGVSNSASSSTNATVSATTTYTVTVTVPSTGCTAAATTAISAVPQPSVTATASTDSICSGGSLTLTAAPTGGFGTAAYSWSGPGILTTVGTALNTVVTPTASATAAGNYSLTLSYSGSGCNNASATTPLVTIAPQPVVSVTASDTIMCQGNPLVLTSVVTGGIGGTPLYTWSGAGITTTTSNAGVSPTFTPSVSAGIYSVSVAYPGSGCTTVTVPTANTIRVNAAPVAAAVTGSSVYCLGSGAPLVLNTTTATGTGTLSSYNWSGPNAFSATTSVPSVSFTPTATTSTGLYSLTVTYPGAGCVSPATTHSVAVGAYPLAYSVTGGNGCSASGITVGLSGSESSAISYSLRMQPSTIVSTVAGTSTTLSFAPVTTTGIYEVVATGSAGCQTLMTGTDTINTTPAITVGTSPSICQPTTAASVSYTLPVGAPVTYNLDWSSAANTAGFTDVTGNVLSGSSITLVVPASGAVGSFTGDITVANGACTSAPFSTGVLVYATPVVPVVTVTNPCVNYVGGVNLTGVNGSVVDYTVDGGTVNNFTFAGTSHTISTGNITTPHVYAILNAHNPVCTTLINDSVTVTPVPMAWLGGAPGHESDWNDSSNWTCGFPPSVSDDASISATMYAPAIPASISVNVNDLTLNSPSLIMLNAGAVLNVKGNVLNTSTISGDGKVVLSGTAQQLVTGIGTISNLELNNATGARIDTGARLMISNALTISSGVLNTNDSLELLSLDTSATARIAPLPTGTSIVGRVKTDQYVQGGFRRYRFWSHSFSDTMSLLQIQKFIDITGDSGSVRGFVTTASNAPSAFRYDPLVANSSLPYDTGWRAITKIKVGATDENMLHPGQGLRLFIRGRKGEGLGYAGYYGAYTPSASTIKMIGHINQGPVSIPMAKGTFDPTNQDYNLLGNPYPSPVDIGTIATNALAAHKITGGAFYLWIASTPGGGQWNIVPIGSPYYIGAHVGFEVRADHDGATLDFVESDKAPSVDNYLFKAPTEYTTLSVYDSNNEMWDMLRINFTDAATDNEDRTLDATKPMGTNFGFYSMSPDGRKLGIDARPYGADKVIPLGVQSAYQQEFVIRANNIVVPQGGSVYLHDKLLSKVVEMQAGSEYKFTISKDKATQGEDRFELSLKPAATTTAKGLVVNMTPNPTTDDVKINFTSGKKEVVTVRVLDMSGVSIYSQNLGEQQNGVVKVPLSTFAAGIYMVELTQGSQKITQKLVKE